MWFDQCTSAMPKSRIAKAFGLMLLSIAAYIDQAPGMAREFKIHSHTPSELAKSRPGTRPDADQPPAWLPRSSPQVTMPAPQVTMPATQVTRPATQVGIRPGTRPDASPGLGAEANR
jgi:hypothetical protein